MERFVCLLFGALAALVILAIATIARSRMATPAPPAVHRDTQTTDWQHDALLGLAALEGDQRDTMLDIIWALAGLSGPDRAAVMTWLRAWRQGRN
jgi:Spy/CpxP family protein refolding chaperone